MNQTDARTVRVVLRYLRVMRWIGYGALLLLVALPVLAWMLLHTQWATQQLVPHIPGVTVSEPRGALLGDFSARRIDIGLPRGSLLRLDEVAWQGLSVYLDPRAQWYTGLHARQLSAKQVQLNWVPNPTPAPSTAPYDLRLPLTITVDRLQAQRGVSTLWGPYDLVGLDGRLELGQLRHVAHIERLAYGPWALKGAGRVRTRGALLGELQLQAVGSQTHAGRTLPVQGTLTANGPLTNLMAATKWTVGQAGGTQSLDARGRLALWAPWALPELQAHADQFDLAALLPTLPRTRITGDVWLSDEAGALKLRADLKNALPGVWDKGQLPVRHILANASLTHASKSGRIQDLLDAGQLDLKVGLPGKDAPVAHVTGQWGGGSGGASAPAQQLTLTFQPTALRDLHTQAPDLSLAGDVGAKAATASKGQAWADAVWTLTGRLMGAYRPGPNASESIPVSTRLTAQWQQGELKLQQWVLQAKEAQANLVGRLGYQSAPELPWGWRWDVKAKADIQQFDPKVWMPWPATLNGRNRLMGELDLSIDSSWQGQASLELKPSELAGLSMGGHFRWEVPSQTVSQRGVRPQRAALDWDLSVAGNRVAGRASLPWLVGDHGWPRIKGEQSWEARVDAPALQSLALLTSAWGMDGLSGRVQGQLSYQGQWPRLRASGQIDAKQVRWHTTGRQAFQLDEARGQWQIGTHDLAGPLVLDAKILGLDLPGLRLDEARLSSTGSLRQHQLEVQASGQPVVRPGQAQGKQWEPMRVRLRLDGGASGSAQGIQSWRGVVQALNWQTQGELARTWLDAEPFALSWSRQGVVDRVAVDAVRLSAMGVPLRLQDLAWQFQDQATRSLVGKLVVEPFKVSKVLSQWQPQTGWGGDLLVGGHMSLSHSVDAPWVIQAQVAKVSGDLTLSEPSVEGNSLQRLGIDVASVGLNARNGVWVLTQVFEGSVLGRVSGRQSIQVATPQRLPSANDALSGALDVQIASLRPWAAWVPAGWRLQGQVEGHAELSGTVGQPQYTGRLWGRNLQLNQALMGVNLTDGSLVMDLQGDQAYLREFKARGGALGGWLRATGQASFGAAPQASLQVQAERFALLQRIDRRLLVSGQAQASLTEADIALQGRVLVDEGMFDFSRSDAPVVGDDVNVINGPGARKDTDEAEEEAGGTKRNLVAVVDIDLGNKLRLKGRGLETDLSGSLKFTTPNNRPRLHGTVRAVNGTYAAYGQKLVIERGAIAFTGPVENPRLDILAMRKQSPMAASSDVKVGVAITGTAQDPRVSLYSEPAMSETDKLSWLVLGRAPSGLGGADIGLLQSAAVALLSGEGPSTTDNIMSSLGLDELSVRQSDGTVRDTVVNVGKQLSKYWYVGYERNLNATSGNWQLIYRLAQRFTLRAQTGIDNAVDLIWSWRWD